MIKHIKGNTLPKNPDRQKGKGRFPSWLHHKLPKGDTFFKTHRILSDHHLNTVCTEAKCPNRSECFSRKTATFLALGKACTRACGFCDIDFAKKPEPPDEKEPERIANSVHVLGLSHVVITMVARDDLPDEGASHLAAIVQAIREQNIDTTVEVLTSDFSGRKESIDTVLAAKPEIFNHNIETVRRLSPFVRHKASYERTLGVLKHVKESGNSPWIKSGIMVGLGEREEEVQETIRDLRDAGCGIVTIGQYLQPNRHKLLVKAFVPPEQFEAYARYGESIGIAHVYSGPFVRSSYNAAFLKNRVFKNHL